jgi:hypothetical protein
MGKIEIETSLHHLIANKEVVACTHNQALNDFLLIHNTVYDRVFDEPINAFRAKRPKAVRRNLTTSIDFNL